MKYGLVNGVYYPSPEEIKEHCEYIIANRPPEEVPEYEWKVFVPKVIRVMLGSLSGIKISETDESGNLPNAEIVE